VQERRDEDERDDHEITGTPTVRQLFGA
jgi:hypothetical protein